MNFMGGAGMFAVSIYMIFMGGYYDRLVNDKLATITNTDAAAALNQAKAAAGPEIINVTMTIPVVLIVAFIGLNLYMRGRNKKVLQAA